MLRGQTIIPFHIFAAFQMGGHVDIAVLERALNTVIARHSGLRSAFFRKAGISNEKRIETAREFLLTGKTPSDIYFQKIEENVHANVTLISGDDTPQFRGKIHEIIKSSVMTPFRYAEPPFIRAYLCELPPAPVLIMVMHHMICDMLSISLLRKELSAVYNSLCAGEDIKLPPNPRGCHEYALLQQYKTKHGKFDKHVAYWSKIWETFGETMVSSNDFEPIAAGAQPDSLTTSAEVLPIDNQFWSAMKKFAVLHKVSAYMLLLSAAFVVLKQLLKRDSIAIMTNLLNRDMEFMNTIGWLSHFNIIGINFSGDDTIDTVLKKVRKTVCEVNDHQEASIGYIINNTNVRLPQSDFRICIDMIPKLNSGIEIQRKNTNECCRFSPAYIPWLELGQGIGGLNISLVDNGDTAHVTAIFAKKHFDNNTVINFLNKIMDILNLCVTEAAEKIEI